MSARSYGLCVCDMSQVNTIVYVASDKASQLLAAQRCGRIKVALLRRQITQKQQPGTVTVARYLFMAHKQQQAQQPSTCEAATLCATSFFPTNSKILVFPSSSKKLLCTFLYRRSYKQLRYTISPISRLPTSSQSQYNLQLYWIYSIQSSTCTGCILICIPTVLGLFSLVFQLCIVYSIHSFNCT